MQSAYHFCITQVAIDKIMVLKAIGIKFGAPSYHRESRSSNGVRVVIVSL